MANIADKTYIVNYQRIEKSERTWKVEAEKRSEAIDKALEKARDATSVFSDDRFKAKQAILEKEHVKGKWLVKIEKVRTSNRKWIVKAASKKAAEKKVKDSITKAEVKILSVEELAKKGDKSWNKLEKKVKVTKS